MLAASGVTGLRGRRTARVKMGGFRRGNNAGEGASARWLRASGTARGEGERRKMGDEAEK